jgi:predicted secreted protein
MAAGYGRNVAFTWEGSAINGVREKSLTVDGEPVNVTSDEDNGIQVLMEEDAELAVKIELSGVTKEDTLRAAKLSGNTRGAATLTYETGGALSGTFQLSAYSEGQVYNDAITFSVTLMSTGPVSYTPES